MSENLNLEIDITILSQAIRNKLVTPRVWTDRNGEEHKSITVLCKVAKEPNEHKSHYLALKQDGSWKKAKGNDGKTLYVGKAYLSKYQPDGNNN